MHLAIPSTIFMEITQSTKFSFNNHFIQFFFYSFWLQCFMGTQHHYITNNIPQKLHSVFWCKIKFYHYHSIVIAGNGDMVPHCVFLAHIVDVSSSMHVQFVYRSFASLPYTTRFFLLPGLPVTFLVLLAMWAWSKTFLVSFYYLRGRLHHTWVVPRCGFQVGPSVKFVSIFIFFLPPWMLERVEIYKYWLTFLFFNIFTVFLAICYWGNQ